jgi:hypothetical protein
MWQGTVVSIHIASAAGSPMLPVHSIRALTGKD